jgi:hypothetical protein
LKFGPENLEERNLLGDLAVLVMLVAVIEVKMIVLKAILMAVLS